MATTSDFIVRNGLSVTGNAFINNSIWAGNASITNTTAATSSTTGALTVAGGIGVAGNVYVGGNINVTNTTQATSATTGALVVSGGVGITGNAFVSNSIWAGNLSVANTTAATSSTSGALTVAGGMGITGNIFVGTTGNVGIGTSTVVSGNAAAVYGGNVFIAGNLRVGNTATTIGGIQFSDGTFQTTAATPPGVATTMTVANQTASTAYYPVFVSGTGTQSLNINTTSLQLIPNSGNITTVGGIRAGNLSVANTTASTSSTTGALVVSGGVGITGNIIVGTTGNVGIGTASVIGGNAMAIYGGNVFVAGNLRVGNTATTIGGIQFSDGTFQTTASTGGSSATITDDTTTTAPRYINFTSATSGTLSAINTSSTKLIYYPLTGNVTIGGNLTVSNAAGISTFAGNVGIGTTTATAGYILSVNGSIAATTKSFVIPHPTKEGKKLQYASLEGPENGVYLRGKLSSYDRIMLPEYWSTLVDMDTITVDLTPFGRYQKLYVGEITNEHITIEIDGWFGKPFINCYYTVYAERRDVPRLMVEV